MRTQAVHMAARNIELSECEQFTREGKKVQRLQSREK